MKRKLLVVVTLILTLIFSINVFAAWKMEGTDWHYYDKNGNMVTNEFKRSGSTYFYLDENGNITKNCQKLIDGWIYTFDSNGKSTRSKPDENGQPMYYENDYGINRRTQYLNRTVNPYNDNAVVQWMNATYAVYTRSRGANIRAYGGALDTTSVDKVEGRPGISGYAVSIQKELQTSWGVTDRASADRELEELLQSAAATGSAWDYSRAMSNLGHYYWAGYYSINEALDKSLEVSGQIQTTYHSWDEFYASYFAGYQAWAGDTAEDRTAIYDGLKGSVFNPFAADWNMELKKTW